MPRRRLPLIAVAALLACSGTGVALAASPKSPPKLVGGPELAANYGGPGDTVNGYNLTLKISYHVPTSWIRVQVGSVPAQVLPLGIDATTKTYTAFGTSSNGEFVIGHDYPISVRVCSKSLCRKVTAVATLTK